MSFASPIWLIGLIPWAALAVWLLIGRREEARVPFVHLWPRGAAPVRTRRSMRRPPVALSCLLLAMLLALVAAARPHVWRNGHARDVTLIVDLAATSPVKEMREFNFVPERILLVNGDTVKEADSSGWLREATTLSSLATRASLRAAVGDALARDARPVVVLSNQRLEGVDSDRVVQVSSASPPQNVGIVRVAARGKQVMVAVRNQSAHPRAELVITSEGNAQRQPIELPPAPGEINVFVDLPGLGRVIGVELVTRDDIDVDNQAWLVRQPSWPAVEVRGALGPELARVVEAYRSLRPSDDGSTRVVIATTPADGPAAVVASDGADQPVEGPLRVADHPINANVDWPAIAGHGARAAALPGGDGWTPIVSSGERALVAVREQPARQVWVGFDSDTWPREAAFVIFWTNVFDWLGHGGAEAYVAEPVQRLGGEWRRLDDLSGSPTPAVEPAPGVYGRADGALRALNAIDLKLDPPAQLDWRAKLSAIEPAPAARSNLSKPALVASLSAALIASLTWASVKRSGNPT